VIEGYLDRQQLSGALSGSFDLIRDYVSGFTSGVIFPYIEEQMSG